MDISREYTAKWLGTGKREVKGICLHDTAGSGLINDVKYLANPSDGRKVSCDFCVTRDGGVYQLNPDLNNNWTYHAGRATSFRGLRNAGVTKGTIGIEIVQKADMSLSPLYPNEQVQAVAELCSKLCKDFDLKKEDITTHAKVITDGSRSDPRKFPWDLFWNYFNSTATGELSENVYHTVKSGDSLWRLSKTYSTSIETLKAFNGMDSASTAIKVGDKLRVK